ncbi:MAG: hypothetical protein ACKKL4_00065 [Patescibacteria group bacterium]
MCKRKESAVTKDSGEVIHLYQGSISPQADGAKVKTTPENQQQALELAWSEVEQYVEAELGLLSYKEMAKKALELAGLGWTPEQALHRLGISQAPRPLVPIMPTPLDG